jgi:pyruvate dehydrogenase E1 component alpha subunit
MTYRYGGHFEGDPQRYRSREEVTKAGEQDPIVQFRDLLRQRKLLSRVLEAKMQQEVEEEMDEAVRFAEESPLPVPEDALEDLYAGDVGWAATGGRG